MGTQWEYFENRKNPKKPVPTLETQKKETISGCTRMNGG